MANERARTLRKTMTPQEVKLWVRLRELRPLGFHFRRQVPRAGYILDFACLKHGIVVEVDGGQHGFRHHAIRDRRLNDDSFAVLRFWNHDIDQNLGGVMDAIVAALEKRGGEGG